MYDLILARRALDSLLWRPPLFTSKLYSSQIVFFSPLWFLSMTSLRRGWICWDKQGWCVNELVERKPFGSLAARVTLAPPKHAFATFLDASVSPAPNPTRLSLCRCQICQLLKQKPQIADRGGGNPLQFSLVFDVFPKLVYTSSDHTSYLSQPSQPVVV